MTKADLIEQLSKVTKLTKKQSEEVVDTVFDSITEALAKGEKVELRGFGSFRIRRRRARARLRKKVSAHLLRHTMATTLLFNGCPIGHIKELNPNVTVEIQGQQFTGTAQLVTDEPLCRKISELKYRDQRALEKRTVIEITLAID